MSDLITRSELARLAIEVFNSWNANEFSQERMDSCVNELCEQALRDPKGVMANTSLTQIMSALYYSYNLLYSISAKIPDEDMNGYGAWCSQVEKWMGVNDSSN